MEHLATTDSPSPSVIELVIERTLEFEVTLETRGRSRERPPPHLAASLDSRFSQNPLTRKVRPVATIKPLPERNQNEEESEPDIPDDIKKTDLIESYQELEFEESCIRCDGDTSSNLTTSVPQTTVEDNCSNTCKDSCVGEESDSTLLEETQLSDQELQQQEPQTNAEEERFPTQSNFTKEEPSHLKDSNAAQTSKESTKDEPKQAQDPCGCHRDWVRALSAAGKTSKFHASYRWNQKMEGEYQEGCQNGEGCEERHGGEDFEREHEKHHHKDSPSTECLDEFLDKLHLSHLADYLRVLGCTCVRDLRLLEKPELDAIQLISRRRLLQELDTVNLHHEAPPADCSLEGWLAWYGLTHVSGFLKAIGVHSVTDISYLREDDLQLLKPVTRRRIIACHRKLT